jgi:hypothetical protein
MLIFDNFATRKQAEAFAAAHNGQVFDSQEESNAVDPFPFELRAPIVLIDRPNLSGILGIENEDEAVKMEQRIEADIIKDVEMYGGTFAGT